MLNSGKRVPMLGKEAIVSFLIENKIGHIFHLPGIHSLPLCDALAKRGGANMVTARHESAVAFAAAGYAQATGQTGVLVVTPGPGLTNIVSACLEAHGAEVPLLIIHIDTDRKESGKGELHELPEPERLFTRITNKTFTVDRKESLCVTLQSAYDATHSGRPGPVLISIPYAFLEKEASESIKERKAAAKKADLSALDKALAGKKKPLIIGGGLLMHEELSLPLEHLCRESAIPFLTTNAGKGALSEELPEAFGCTMRKGVVKKMLAEADVVIAIGTRLRDVDTKRRGVKLPELIHIDVDDAWIGRNYPAGFRIAGNLKRAVDGLCRIMKDRRASWRIDELKALQRREEAELLRHADGFRIVRLLREVIPDDTITVWDLNLLAYWAEYYYPVLQQRTFLEAGGSSTIFYAVPASIGAKIARPERPCLCIAGDGGGLPMLGELATIRQFKIPVVFLVYNNNSFGVLEQCMKKRYSLEGSMLLANPDFVHLAHAFEIPAKRVENLDELRKVFLVDVRWDEPFLIEFKYPQITPPWEAI
jgi:acetolactate synthase-1/2/3 large subunit